MLFALVVAFITRIPASFQVQYCDKPPPVIKNSFIEFYGATKYKCCGYVGEVKYQCVPGFSMKGNPTVRCINGKWHKPPSCIELKRCSIEALYNSPHNAFAENETIYINKNKSYEIIPGSFITWRCHRNFAHDQTSGPLIMQCQPNGRWTDYPRCIPEKALCKQSLLKVPWNAHTVKEDLKSVQGYSSHFLEGSYVEYRCNEHFERKIDSGDFIVTCLANGSWSTFPECEMSPHHPTLRRCKLRPSFTGVKTTILKNNVLRYNDNTFDGSYVYACLDDTEEPVSEGGVIKCVNGSWVGELKCVSLPTCAMQDLYKVLPVPQTFRMSRNFMRHSPHNQYLLLYRSVLEVECAYPYIHDVSSGSLNITCKRDGTWTEQPRCIFNSSNADLNPVDKLHEPVKQKMNNAHSHPNCEDKTKSPTNAKQEPIRTIVTSSKKLTTAEASSNAGIDKTIAHSKAHRGSRLYLHNQHERSRELHVKRLNLSHAPVSIFSYNRASLRYDSTTKPKSYSTQISSDPYSIYAHTTIITAGKTKSIRDNLSTIFNKSFPKSDPKEKNFGSTFAKVNDFVLSYMPKSDKTIFNTKDYSHVNKSTNILNATKQKKYFSLKNNTLLYRQLHTTRGRKLAGVHKLVNNLNNTPGKHRLLTKKQNKARTNMSTPLQFRSSSAIRSSKKKMVPDDISDYHNRSNQLPSSAIPRRRLSKYRKFVTVNTSNLNAKFKSVYERIPAPKLNGTHGDSYENTSLTFQQLKNTSGEISSPRALTTKTSAYSVDKSKHSSKMPSIKNNNVNFLLESGNESASKNAGLQSEKAHEFSNKKSYADSLILNVIDDESKQRNVTAKSIRATKTAALLNVSPDNKHYKVHEFLMTPRTFMTKTAHYEYGEGDKHFELKSARTPRSNIFTEQNDTFLKGVVQLVPMQAINISILKATESSLALSFSDNIMLPNTTAFSILANKKVNESSLGLLHTPPKTTDINTSATFVMTSKPQYILADSMRQPSNACFVKKETIDDAVDLNSTKTTITDRKLEDNTINTAYYVSSSFSSLSPFFEEKDQTLSSVAVNDENRMNKKIKKDEVDERTAPTGSNALININFTSEIETNTSYVTKQPNTFTENYNKTILHENDYSNKSIQIQNIWSTTTEITDDSTSYSMKNFSFFNFLTDHLNYNVPNASTNFGFILCNRKNISHGLNDSNETVSYRELFNEIVFNGLHNLYNESASQHYTGSIVMNKSFIISIKENSTVDADGTGNPKQETNNVGVHDFANMPSMHFSEAVPGVNDSKETLVMSQTNDSFGKLETANTSNEKLVSLQRECRDGSTSEQPGGNLVDNPKIMTLFNVSEIKNTSFKKVAVSNNETTHNSADFTFISSNASLEILVKNLSIIKSSFPPNVSRFELNLSDSYSKKISRIDANFTPPVDSRLTGSSQSPSTETILVNTYVTEKSPMQANTMFTSVTQLCSLTSNAVNRSMADIQSTKSNATEIVWTKPTSTEIPTNQPQIIGTSSVPSIKPNETSTVPMEEPSAILKQLSIDKLPSLKSNETNSSPTSMELNAVNANSTEIAFKKSTSNVNSATQTLTDASAAEALLAESEANDATSTKILSVLSVMNNKPTEHMNFTEATWVTSMKSNSSTISSNSAVEFLSLNTTTMLATNFSTYSASSFGFSSTNFGLADCSKISMASDNMVANYSKSKTNSSTSHVKYEECDDRKNTTMPQGSTYDNMKVTKSDSSQNVTLKLVTDTPAKFSLNPVKATISVQNNTQDFHLSSKFNTEKRITKRSAVYSIALKIKQGYGATIQHPHRGYASTQKEDASSHHMQKLPMTFYAIPKLLKKASTYFLNTIML